MIRMELLDGKKLSEIIRAELKSEVESMLKNGEKRPHLAAILVGDNPASRVYVRNKIRLCKEAGFESSMIERPADISEKDLLNEIDKLNEDDSIDGYIVQLPLPRHIDASRINLAIDPVKDVDGFHPVNMGRMTLGLPSYLPATPQGILTMLERYDIETNGKHAVVIGRSNIVGTPMSILLSSDRPYCNATVTQLHSRSGDRADLIRQADLIVTAVGIPYFIKEDMVKEGAVVIDVGINKIDDPSRKRGYRLVGDVDFDNVAPKCSYITPVPGGVGRMTVISLLMNTLKAAKNQVYA